MMQPASDKTFHLKWNNHLQNLSQLFTTIYSSSSLADVTLSCRDGSIHAHKLVLSACSPYFEQIFKENPCKHPTIILKGIPYAEINLLVEFMYKGSVDVQEIDLQSLMHTASELEIRGLAYEVRKDASSLLNVNLNEYPNFPPAATLGQDNPFPPGFDPGSAACSSPYNSTPRQVNPYQTNLERLRQIHMYQQAMCRNQPYTAPQPTQPQPEMSTIKRKRKNEEQMPATTTTAVKNILAAAAKELENKKTTKTSTCIQTEDDLDVVNMTIKNEEIDLDEAPAAHGRDTRYKGRKRVSVGEVGVEFAPIISKVKSGADFPVEKRAHGVKCVSFQDLKEKAEENDDSSALETSADENNLLVERAYEHVPELEEEYDSSDSKAEAKTSSRGTYKCDMCDQRYTRKAHMFRHRRTHSGERPFKCTSCHYSFTRSSHLARHRRTHTGERPFRCDACGRCFARGDKLKLHMKICEKDEYTLPGNSSAAASTVTEEKVHQGEPNSMTSGMVSIGHSERHQLMFTPSGDVMLAPRSQSQQSAGQHEDSVNDISANETTSHSITDNSATSPSSNTNKSYSDKDYPIKRGRGRPRKKPLPPVESPAIKKKRGRPPKIIKIEPTSETGNTRSMEIYNPSNLPYGDFNYLTDILSTHFNQSTQQAYQNMLQMNPMLAVNALQSALSSQAGLPSLVPQALQNIENLKNQATLQDKINSAISAQIAHHTAPSVLHAPDKPGKASPDLSDMPNDLSTKSDHTPANLTNENGNENLKSPEVPSLSNNFEENKTMLSEASVIKEGESKVITTGEIQISAISGNCTQVTDPQVKSIIPNLNDCTIQPIPQKD